MEDVSLKTGTGKVIEGAPTERIESLYHRGL